MAKRKNIEADPLLSYVPPSEQHGPSFNGVQIVALETLRHNPANLRQHDEAQISDLMRNMRKFGWTMPLLVDEAGLLIAGHARLTAATRLRWSDAPVVRAVGWSDEDKRVYLIADNALALRSTWDKAGLQAEVQSLNTLGVNLNFAGLPTAELQALLASPMVMAGAADEPAYASRKHVRILTLQIARADWDTLQGKLKRLAALYGTDNSTDTILRAIDSCLTVPPTNSGEQLDRSQAQ